MPTPTIDVRVASVQRPTTRVPKQEGKQKRVRLRPETREQLLERLTNPQITLHEASILLRVSPATVRRYSNAGRLPCIRTPGGQRRFLLGDVSALYRALRNRK